MRFLTLILCLVVVVAVIADGYDYGQLYRYEYRGYIYSGFTGLKSQHSGVAFVSDVLLYRYEDYYVIQLDRVRFDKFNSEVDNFDEQNYEYRHLPSVTRHLTKPVKVYFDNGEIKHYEVASDEEVWSLNIKRGLLSLFNLNFEGNSTLRTYEDRKHLHRTNPVDHYYEVYEDGIGGECETAYVVLSEPYYETPYENNVLNVTKSRNYHNCIRQPYRRYLGQHGYQCVECEEQKTHPFHANSRYYYNIRGNRNHYVIERIISEGEVFYSPYTTYGQTIYVYLNRTLSLIEERDETPIDHVIKDHNYIRYTSLAYEFEEERRVGKLIDLKRPHYLYHVYGHQLSVDEASRLLHELAVYEAEDRRDEHYKSKNIPGKFVELIKVFSTLDYDSIEEVYRRWIYEPREAHLTERERSTIEHLFVSVLAVTGTNPVFVFSKYLIEGEKINHELAKYYLETAPSHLKEPSEVLLDEFYRLCKHPTVQTHYNLRSACYLALSGLVHQTCVVKYKLHHDSEHERHCTPEKAVRYFNYLIPQYRYETDVDQVLYIKTAGNFGLRETIEYIRPYVVNRDRYPLYFRVTALWSLFRASSTHPDEVLNLVVPLYFDTTEDYELRIIAFVLLITSHAPDYYLETVANSQW